MKYKALFIDYDGTTAPIGTITQINQPSKKVKVCLATGRPLVSVSKVIKKLKLNSYCILLNGAQIIDAFTQKTIYQVPLKIQAIKQIYSIVKKYQLTILCSDFHHEFYVNSLKQLLTQPIADIYFAGVLQPYIKSIDQQLSQIKNINPQKLRFNSNNSLQYDITDIHASKQLAIFKVQKLLKLKPNQIIGIGDGHNDFPLLMASGLKVAMGNAEKELKEIAGYIAPSVEKDGLARVIKKYIL